MGLSSTTTRQAAGVARPGWFERLLVAYCRGPEHPAKQRILHWLGRRVFPAEGVTAPVEGGFWLCLHPRDSIERLLLTGRAYEPLTLRFLAANLRPGDAALLAGVNFGLHVIVTAAAVGSTGRVVGVEPQPATILRARLNLELNGMAQRVRLVLAALGECPTVLALPPTNPENAGASSLLDHDDSGFEVSVLRVADLLAERQGPRLRLALLDVQGYEDRVLAGLGDVRPELMVVEADEPFLARAQSSRAELLAVLARLGYEVRDLHGGTVDSRSHLPEQNLVAVAAGAAVDWVR